MSLPISLDNVPYYKISGLFTFKGDLIITRDKIYFFPHTDLEQQRMAKSQRGGLSMMLLEPVVRPIVSPLVLALAVRGKNHSKLRKAGIWREGDSSETLQAKLDSQIEQLKQNRTLSSNALPAPSFFKRDEVSNLKLSSTGVLSFDAQSDKHDFSVGIFKKKLLREALWECGFISN